MIVGICSDKGSPGATTLSVALGMVWPGPRVVLECDPAGADLPFRLRNALSGEMVSPEPSVAAVAAAARLDADPGELAGLAQPTTLGVPVIPGSLTPERAAALRGLWPAVADLAAGWDGTMITDLGRLQPGSAVLPVAQAAAVTVLVARHCTEGLFHLRERVGVLGAALADPTTGPRLVIVMSGPAGRGRDALRECRDLLDSIGSTAPVGGFLPLEPAELGALWAGEPTRRLLHSRLMKATRHIADEVAAAITSQAGEHPAPPLGDVAAAPPAPMARPGLPVWTGGPR